MRIVNKATEFLLLAYMLACVGGDIHFTTHGDMQGSDRMRLSVAETGVLYLVLKRTQSA